MEKVILEKSIKILELVLDSIENIENISKFYINYDSIETFREITENGRIFNKIVEVGLDVENNFSKINGELSLITYITWDNIEVGKKIEKGKIKYNISKKCLLDVVLY